MHITCIYNSYKPTKVLELTGFFIYGTNMMGPGLEIATVYNVLLDH